MCLIQTLPQKKRERILKGTRQSQKWEEEESGSQMGVEGRQHAIQTMYAVEIQKIQHSELESDWLI